ncbi:LuxR C-terminal-related transcriptional regulator [Nocardia sp. NPDC046763]|uniref:ATP-binding protein n=1 Tax=Nocardia sp. NPDC046763 TaxID=3155256 RepID=UPI0033E9E02F
MTRRARGNLPVEVTSFVGRRAELAAARSLLQTTRVLTLTGPGGVGKSRLARELGAAVVRAFPDGVWLVELAEVRDPALVAVAVAETLELRDDAVVPSTRLTEFLTGRRLVLVLDNCEHLIPACADLVTRIVSATTDVRIVATSRQVIGVPGERVFDVPPLSVHDGTGDGDAVSLLIDRATAAAPGLAVTGPDRATLAAICVRVDGIPLAVELVALRLRALTPAQVLALLDDTLELLTTGPRTAPQRQRTLEAAVRWSYDLCEPAEQRVWEQLSVFAGAFALDAADAVSEPVPGATLLSALIGLVDKSVLTLHRDTGRYSMLEPLRQFGRRRLSDRGAEQHTRTRHLRYYRDVALRGHIDYGGRGDLDWFRAITDEHPNVRAALRYALDHHHPVWALEMAAALRPFWEHNRHLSEGMGWLTEALARNPDPSTARARGLAVAASVAAMLSQRAEAVRLIDECRALTADLGEADLLPELALDHAMVAVVDADVAHALESAVAAADLARRSAQPTIEMDSLSLAIVCAVVMNDPASRPLVDRLIACTAEHGPQLLGGLADWCAGIAQWRSGHADTADIFLRCAVERFSRFGRCVWLASAFDGLAWTAVSHAEYVRAATLLGAAETLDRNALTMADALTGAIGADVRRQLRKMLTPTAFRGAYDRGARFGLTEAIDYALGRTATSASDQRPDTARQPEHRALTRREHQVARLVATGYSNKRIAAELVVSVRTAETHVEHILVKLGLTSRIQIAMWLRDQL